MMTLGILALAAGLGPPPDDDDDVFIDDGDDDDVVDPSHS